jgi:NhaA family Na+:H+ antiporter
MPNQSDASTAGESGPMPIEVLMRPVHRFLRHELAGAALLLLSTVAALVWANTAWADAYYRLLHIPVSVSVAGQALEKSLQHFINDGLMGFFFFLVGLEIKREVLVGELSTRRNAMMPAVAALGGMLVPALLYVAVNPEPPQRAGWGIPMATDIAFALGLLAVLGDRIPFGLRIMLTALAIVDDIGAVLVIALFYTDQIATIALLGGVFGLVLSAGLNALGVRNAIAYFILGTLVWLAFLQSGVHATIAALLMAFTIPSSTRIDGRRLVRELERALQRLHDAGLPQDKGLNTEEQRRILDEIARIRHAATAPLQNLEHALSPIVTFGVLPVFALANAGVSLRDLGPDALGGGIALGVAVGLLLGKPIGIVVFSWIAVRVGIADLPRGVSWRQVVGIGLLGGIGFTMALFIASLAFETPAELDAAKLGILVASTIAAIAGLLTLRGAPRSSA